MPYPKISSYYLDPHFINEERRDRRVERREQAKNKQKFRKKILCLCWGVHVSSNPNIAFGIAKKPIHRSSAHLLNCIVIVIFHRNSVKSAGDSLGWPFNTDNQALSGREESP